MTYAVAFHSQMILEIKEQLPVRLSGIEGAGGKYPMFGSIATVRQKVDHDFMRQVSIGHKCHRDIASLEIHIKRENIRIGVADVLFGGNFLYPKHFRQSLA